MSNTIFQLFPGVQNAIERIEARPARATFTAPLVGGKFVFDFTNQIFSLAQNQMGVVAGVSLAANIDQLAFSNAIDPTVNQGCFNLALFRNANKTMVNKSPFFFSSFGQGSAFSALMFATGTNNGREDFNLRLQGSLLQTPALVSAGVSSVSIVALLDFYQCKDFNGGKA